MSYCIVAVIVIFFILVITIIYLGAINKDQKQKLKEKDEYALGLSNELWKLKEEMRIRGEAKNEADKKIDDLHNGDAVANAINSLSKHKGS